MSKNKYFSIIVILKLIFYLIKNSCARVVCEEIFDCFNCVVYPYCKWHKNTSECKLYDTDSIYTIDNPFKYENDGDSIYYAILNKYLLFIKDVCYEKFTPFKVNDNKYYYSEMSSKYCGPHLVPVDENSVIELQLVNNAYGYPNIVCEYIFEYCPSEYEAVVTSKGKYIKDFMLFFHSDHYLITNYQITDTSKSIELNFNPGKNLLGFTYYSKVKFEESPFKITFRKRHKIISQVTGIFLCIFITASLIIIVFCIIYIRNNSKILRPDIPGYNCEEVKKLVVKKTDSTTINTGAISNNQNIDINSKISRSVGTPDQFISKESNKKMFSFDTPGSKTVNKSSPEDEKIDK